MIEWKMRRKKKKKRRKECRESKVERNEERDIRGGMRGGGGVLKKSRGISGEKKVQIEKKEGSGSQSIFLMRFLNEPQLR